MSEPLNFRSAFNGFNREDVVHYIEYLNSKHENKVRQLQADLATMQRESFLADDEEDQNEFVEQMKEQFEQQEALLTALNTEKDELLSKCVQLEADLAALTAENQSLASKAKQLEAQLATVVAERDAAAAKPRMSAYVEDELAAYRRAERVERLATERAHMIYRNLRTALQDTAAKTDHAVTNLDNISGQFSTQLNALRSSLSDSKSYLDQTLFSLNDLCSSPIDE
jgi:DNA repair exonuclease SbcCD ATPase subunit